MLAFVLPFLFSAANAADPGGWGDFPTRPAPLVEGERVVHLLGIDRARFGRLPVKLDFRAEIDRSVRDIAVLDPGR